LNFPKEIKEDSRRKTFKLLIFFFFTCSVIYSDIKSDAINPNKGIRTEIKLEYKYRGDNDQPKEYLYIKTITDYDENGTKIKHSRYDSSDSLMETYLFKYNFQNNIVEQKRFDSKGDYKGKDLFNIIKVESNGDDSDENLDWEYSYKYDSNGKIIEQLRYDAGENLKQRDVYKYDSQGNLVEELWLRGESANVLIGDAFSDVFPIAYDTLDSSSDIKDRYIYKYDTKGNNIERSRKSPNKSLNWTYTYRYNRENKVIEEIIYEYELRLGKLEEVPTSKTTFEYIFYNNIK